MNLRQCLLPPSDCCPRRVSLAKHISKINAHHYRVGVLRRPGRWTLSHKPQYRIVLPCRPDHVTFRPGWFTAASLRRLFHHLQREHSRFFKTIQTYVLKQSVSICIASRYLAKKHIDIIQLLCISNRVKPGANSFSAFPEEPWQIIIPR